MSSGLYQFHTVREYSVASPWNGLNCAEISGSDVVSVPPSLMLSRGCGLYCACVASDSGVWPGPAEPPGPEPPQAASASDIATAAARPALLVMTRIWASFLASA